MAKKARVLIVDDVAENITIVKNILKPYYDVIVSTTGEKALDLVSKQEHLPDLILLDILMPKMDGFEVCQKLKSNEVTKDIPIIFLTVLDHAEDIVKGFECGGVDYVTKPFEVNVLLARVNTHIELKQNKDQLVELLEQKDKVLIQQSKLASLGEMFESIMQQWKHPLSIISTSNANIRVEQELQTLTEESLIKMLDGIDTTVDHLDETIDVFRDYLIETNQKEYFSTSDIVNRALKLLDSKLKQENISVTTKIQNCEIFSLKNCIMQILINILTNAVQALENKTDTKEILISFKCNEEITISIEDNGGGILLEDINVVFEKQYTTKKGTGLGLYICKHLTQDILDGKIDVKNKEDGTRFRVTIPKK